MPAPPTNDSIPIVVLSDPNSKIPDSETPYYISHVAHIHNYCNNCEEPGVPTLSHPDRSWFHSQALLNNSYWNNQLETELGLGGNNISVNNNRRYTISTFSTTDLVQNDINRRLTLESTSKGTTTSTTTTNYRRFNNKIINVSSHDADFGPKNLPQSDPSFLSSHLSLDLLNMGKIQEFRDKVGVSQVKMPQKDIWRCLGAEFIGTFMLVLIGCGSTLQLEGGEKPTLLAVALCFGLIVATLAEVSTKYIFVSKKN